MWFKTDSVTGIEQRLSASSRDMLLAHDYHDVEHTPVPGSVAGLLDDQQIGVPTVNDGTSEDQQTENPAGIDGEPRRTRHKKTRRRRQAQYRRAEARKQDSTARVSVP